jgi:hypothetical protein
MKPSEVASSLSVLAKIQKPAFLWGSPGVGKSQIVAQVGVDPTVVSPAAKSLLARFLGSCSYGKGRTFDEWRVLSKASG